MLGKRGTANIEAEKGHFYLTPASSKLKYSLEFRRFYVDRKRTRKAQADLNVNTSDCWARLPTRCIKWICSIKSKQIPSCHSVVHVSLNIQHPGSPSTVSCASLAKLSILPHRQYEHEASRCLSKDFWVGLWKTVRRASLNPSLQMLLHVWKNLKQMGYFVFAELRETESNFLLDSLLDSCSGDVTGSLTRHSVSLKNLDHHQQYFRHLHTLSTLTEREHGLKTVLLDIDIPQST